MIRRAQPWLGTLVEIAIDDGIGDEMDDESAHRHAALAFAEIALVQRLMGFHDPHSDVTRLNRAPPGAVLAVHAHTWTVLQMAQAVTLASHGCFDIACAPQLVAWRRLPAPAPGPAPAYRPGHAVLSCEEHKLVRKLAPGWIDLGGIAKGYAVDLAIGALERAGVGAACVNAGGDLRVIGARPLAVTIRDPRQPAREAREIVLKQEAMATSGSYFSAGVEDGAVVSALLDGRSGRPLLDPVSVSVRAPTCAAADALTKVVLASGDAHHPALRQWNATALVI